MSDDLTESFDRAKNEQDIELAATIDRIYIDAEKIQGIPLDLYDSVGSIRIYAEGKIKVII